LDRSLLYRLEENAVLWWTHVCMHAYRCMEIYDVECGCVRLLCMRVISQDAEWGRQRFMDKIGGPYLCGQFKGLSKFASIGLRSDLNDAVNGGKAALIKALGLEGYYDVTSSEPMYVVSIQPHQSAASSSTAALDGGSLSLLDALQPSVPIIYKIGVPSSPSSSTSSVNINAGNTSNSPRASPTALPPAIDTNAAAPLPSLRWMMADNFLTSTVRVSCRQPRYGCCLRVCVRTDSRFYEWRSI